MTPTGPATVTDVIDRNLKSLLQVNSRGNMQFFKTHRERRKEIADELARLAQLYELADKYSLLAKKDPRVKKLIAEYKKLI